MFYKGTLDNPDEKQSLFLCIPVLNQHEPDIPPAILTFLYYLHDFTTFIDDTLAAELTVLRHSLLFWILCCFRYFSRKWHKIPAGEFVR